MTDDILIPDGIVPVVGWRAWRVANSGLLSINNSQHWPTGEPLKAECNLHDRSFPTFITGVTATSSPIQFMNFTSVSPVTPYPPFKRVGAWDTNHYEGDEVCLTWDLLRGDEPQMTIPAESCSCGIYAAKGMNEAVNYLHGQSVLGRVALWGRVTVHEVGWRGEYAYPQAFYTDDDEIRKIIEPYGAPILPLSELVARKNLPQPEQITYQSFIGKALRVIRGELNA